MKKPPAQEGGPGPGVKWDRSSTRGYRGAAITAASFLISMRRVRARSSAHLAAQGVGIDVVSRVLGHSSMAFTADVYGHLTERMTQDAADRMDSVLRPREAASS